MRKTWWGLLVGALVLSLLASVPERAVAANNCTDPYWAFTLRCQTIPNGVAPQPNLTEAPQRPAEIKDFTRVFLMANPSIRSFDGTIPIMYVDKAVCTQQICPDGATYGMPTHSNDWLFTFTGGGSCSVEESGTPGVFDDPSSCVRTYLRPTERGEMSTANDPAMQNLAGIQSPDQRPGRNPVFAGFNRVRINKSSYDRYMGRATYGPNGPNPWRFSVTTQNGRTYRFNLYQHGFLIIKEALQMLGPGLTYTTWKENGPREVIEETESLPPLSEADSVLFIGHSGAAHGLMHNSDHLQALLPNADVRSVIDANFVEGTENEAAFAPPAGGNAYTGDWNGITTGDGAPFAYHGEMFYRGGIFTKQFAAWDAVTDDSCRLSHGPAGAWRCNDRYHVLFNHITTPFFVREDFRDPNQEHTDGHTGHDVIWGDYGNYPWCATNPCLPRLSLAQHKEHLYEQASRLILDSGAASELAMGFDPSMPGPAPFPAFSVWMPACSAHAGVMNNAQFRLSTISYQGVPTTLRGFVEQFVQGPRIGPPSWLIDGYVDPAGQQMQTTACP
ncbi:MAG: hypothetical protein ACRDJM_08830 [Actinomycetota bacterium]